MGNIHWKTWSASNLPDLELSKTVTDIIMVLKYRFSKYMSNKLEIFRSNRKIGRVLSLGGKRLSQRIWGYDTGKDGGGILTAMIKQPLKLILRNSLCK